MNGEYEPVPSLEYVPSVYAVVLLEGEPCGFCICRHCRRFTDPELIEIYGDFYPLYRKFKRQQRMRRKRRRGYA